MVRRILLLGAFLIPPAASAAPAPEPWVARGDEVEASYKSYTARLDRFYASFTDLLKKEAPDLIPPEPAPVAHGYQLLPKLLPDAAPSAKLPRAEIRAYTWPWTRAMIGREAEKLDALEAGLARARTAPTPDRRALYAKLVTDYSPLPVGKIMIDNHIQYNRLWQNNIAANRAFYDRQTILENAVVERQAVRDALEAPGDAASRRALQSREEALSRDIHDATDEISPPAFIRVERPTPHSWIVRIPFVTDIEDEKFLQSFRSAVESSWHMTDGEDDYRVAVSITRISTARLYQGSSTPPPKTGDPIDIPKHLALFPPGSAVLTTGATITYVTGAHCIVIGTNELKPHDLAHEFGHILGFKDVYFRGYKDLGVEGFDVQEVIAGVDDIMGSGPVRKGHFTRLIETLAR